MRIRAFAFVVVLQFTVTPVLGMLCQMDCDQPPKAAACHETTASSDGATVRSAHHLCDHDHRASPALLASVAAIRDSVGSLFVPLSIAAVTDAAVVELPATLADMHGPPGLSGRSVSSRITILRI